MAIMLMGSHQNSSLVILFVLSTLATVLFCAVIPDNNNGGSLTIVDKRVFDLRAVPEADEQKISSKNKKNESPNCTCGNRNEDDRIVGGREAKVGEFPWRCELFFADPNNGFRLFCGCSVISENWVLTAAHCTNAFPGRQIYVDAGDYDLSNTTEIENQVIKVAKVDQHEDYNTLSHDNDVSLLRLEKPLNFSRTISPICLPWRFTKKDFENATVVASGSGTTREGGPVSKILRTVELPLLTTEECRKYYGNHIVTDNMICTYSPGSDTCQGDSGSSIDFKDDETGQYFALGVVSWGAGCARVDKPGVYAQIRNYLGWIESHAVGDNLCKA